MNPCGCDAVVAMRCGEGRTRVLGSGAEVEVPTWYQLPTCTACGAQAVTAEDASEVDRMVEQLANRPSCVHDGRMEHQSIDANKLMHDLEKTVEPKLVEYLDKAVRCLRNHQILNDVLSAIHDSGAVVIDAEYKQKEITLWLCREAETTPRGYVSLVFHDPDRMRELKSIWCGQFENVKSQRRGSHVIKNIPPHRDSLPAPEAAVDFARRGALWASRIDDTPPSGESTSKENNAEPLCVEHMREARKPNGRGTSADKLAAQVRGRERLFAACAAKGEPGLLAKCHVAPGFVGKTFERAAAPEWIVIADVVRDGGVLDNLYLTVDGMPAATVRHVDAWQRGAGPVIVLPRQAYGIQMGSSAAPYDCGTVRIFGWSFSQHDWDQLELEDLAEE
jgi:hypothetical protein